MVDTPRIFLVAVLGIFFGGCKKTPPEPLYLARQTAQATRLEVSRPSLRPRIVARSPAEIAWRVEGGAAQREGTALVFLADAQFTARAEIAVTPGVEYAARLTFKAASPPMVRMRAAVPEKQLAQGKDLSGDEGWEEVPGKAVDGQLVFQQRLPPAGAHVELRVDGVGPTTVTGVELREASLLGPLMRVSSEDVDLLASLRRPVDGRVQRSLEVLLATGRSRYEWPLSPAQADARVLDLETALVPRHGDGGDTPGLEMRVELHRAGAWEIALRARRGGDHDDGRYQKAKVPLDGADALRLSTAPIEDGDRSGVGNGSGGAQKGAQRPLGSDGKTVTVAWGRPVIRAAQRGVRPDVLLLSIDALRADRLGLYGDGRGLSPNLDRLGGEGAVFEEARAQRGQTWESLTSLGWASAPEHVGVWERGLLPTRGLHSVAESFAAAGYLTARIGKYQMPVGQLGPMDIEEETDDDQQTLGRVAALLAEEHDRPLYIAVHLVATHYPYNMLSPEFMPAGDSGELSIAELGAAIKSAGPPEQLRRITARYEAGIRQADAMVGQLMKELDRPDRPGGPAVAAITADHGSHQGEEGLWFLHSTLYRPVLRIPLLLHAPGRIPGGKRVTSLVRLYDVGPTLLDYANSNSNMNSTTDTHTNSTTDSTTDPNRSFDGLTLRPLIEGQPSPGRVNVVQLPTLEMVVVENDTYKLIANPRNYHFTWAEFGDVTLAIPALQLFHWRDDPGEAHNLIEREPLVAGELWRQVISARGTLTRAVSPEARRLLQQAGYAEPEHHDDL